jgi:PPK2 family polyphosphate:nucleotide phosphotransferase
MDRYRITPGTAPNLSDRDTRDTSYFDDGKKQGKDHLRDLAVRLEGLQELLYAEGRRRVLVVLQAMDTGGKDGTIRHVFEGVNPQGVDVASFKKPGEHELARDYLWRVHQRVPVNGEIMIFNRSHYEDVLVVRVHSLVPEERWLRRFDHINAFERMLADEGTAILKFFLHISKEEQAERLRSRLDEPEKHWKFSRADLEERARWDEYVAAYEDAISRTSTDWAPWYVVPADRKWYRNLVVAGVLVNTLEGFDMKYPEGEDLSDVVVI